MHAIRIQSQYIMVSPEEIIQCGQVVIRHGKIVEVTTRITDQADIDLGNTVLIPGLVNPHTHLEFSELPRPFPAGKSFPEWIRVVVEYRRQRQAQLGAIGLRQHLRRSIDFGLSESFSYGVAALCDIVTPPWSYDCLAGKPTSIQQAPSVDKALLSRLIRASISQADLSEHVPNAESCPYVMACLEHIGLDDQRISLTRQWARECETDSQTLSPERLISIDYSPHAPYSTQWPLVCEVIEKARSNRKLVAMHIAESRDEQQWLQAGTGAFREAFERLGIQSSHEKPSTHDVLEQLGRAPRALLIHGNYLTQHEIELAAKYHERLSIVYCPRTHVHFQHSPYPLNAMRQAGLRVVLGTDSRASNPDLNLWQEARCALSKHAELSPGEALRAITCDSAEALGVAHRFGSITVGSEACLNMAIAPPAAVQKRDLCAWLLESVDSLTPLSNGWSSNLKHYTARGGQ